MQTTERVCAYYSKDGKCMLWDQTDKSNLPSKGKINGDYEIECAPAVREADWWGRAGVVKNSYVSERTVNQLISDQRVCNEYIPGSTTAAELAQIYRAEKGIPSGIYIDALLVGDVAVKDLRTGDEIVGLTDIFDLDKLASILGHAASLDEQPQHNRPTHIFTRSTSPSQAIEKDLEKRHFLGTKGSVTAVILEPEISLIPQRTTIVAGSVYTFLAKVDILSNKHLVGAYFQKTSVGFRKTEKVERVVFGHKRLKGIAGTDVIDMLRLSSSANWTSARLQALARTTSGGLPSLGKNR